jgi:hypothetical protein
MLSDAEVRDVIDHCNGSMKVVNWEGYNPQTGIWALSQAIGFGEVFKPDDVIVTNLLRLVDSVDDQEGIPEGTAWMPHSGLCTYFSMFEAQAWLMASRGDKAIEYLYAFANHASPARVWREEQSLRASNSSEVIGDMPHNWGACMFIILVRNMVVLEKANSIELLAGLPEEWLPRVGKKLYIERTPSKHGWVTLEMTLLNEDVFSLKFRIENARRLDRILLHWNGTVEGNANVRRSSSVWVCDGNIGEFDLVLMREQVEASAPVKVK